MKCCYCGILVPAAKLPKVVKGGEGGEKQVDQVRRRKRAVILRDRKENATDLIH